MEVSSKSKIISAVLLAFVIGTLIRVFILEGFIVSGDSMEPTIHSGDFVIINKLAYKWSEPERGDVVVTLTRENNIRLLKRIVGMPGEYFDIKEGTVSIKGSRTATSTPLDEKYLNGGIIQETSGYEHTKLDPGEYFALGDNREVSVDSRELGLIDKWDIKGKVFAALSFKQFSYKGF